RSSLAAAGEPRLPRVAPRRRSMTRTWKMFGLPTALALVLAGGPAARAGDETDLKDIAGRLKKIETGMAKNLEGADLVQAEGLRIKTLVGKINRLEEQVGKMQTLLDALKKVIPPQDRVALYPPEAMDIAKRLELIEKILAERLGASVRVAKAPPEVGR